jgi:hypothetical protein
MTRQHLGLLLTVVGTILLAFSLKVYEGGLAIQMTDKKGRIISPSQATINRYMFWAGLGCIAVGTMFQW